MQRPQIDGVQLPTAGAFYRPPLVIIGAMNVAQRGTSSTTSGYGTVDRFTNTFNGGAVTQTQETLTSGDPFDAGFTKFLRTQNTTAATGAGNFRQIQYRFEGQDIANSGWKFTSTTSYVTLCFWVRASVTQTYYGFVQTRDGSDQIYSFPIALTANTWTKITETILGPLRIKLITIMVRGFK